MAPHTATIANAPTPARPTRARRRLRELRPMLWFVPVLLLLLTVTLYPTVFVIWMSFQKTRYYELKGFVGLENFVDALSSRAFWETAYTSLVYMVGSLVLSLGLGVLAALVLNNLKRGGAVRAHAGSLDALDGGSRNYLALAVQPVVWTDQLLDARGGPLSGSHAARS